MMMPLRGERVYTMIVTALAAVQGSPVDLVEFDAIRNPYFRRLVEATLQLVYAA
jgi:hypothetical protein